MWFVWMQLRYCDFLFFKQKTAYERRISDWSSDVCSSDLAIRFDDLPGPWAVVGESAAGAAPDRSVGPGEAMRIFTGALLPPGADTVIVQEDVAREGDALTLTRDGPGTRGRHIRPRAADFAAGDCLLAAGRSEEHTSELQSLMRIS